MILCLDYGSRYIGIAITDDDERLALRHSVIDQKKMLALPALLKLIEAEGVGTVVVGVPVSLSGRESHQTHATRAFITQLRVVLDEQVKIEETDETLTSWQADRQVAGEGGKPEDAHMEAARLMLADYLARRVS